MAKQKAITPEVYYPSIVDLGRYLATVARLSRDITERVSHEVEIDPRSGLLYRQEYALQRVIAARIATTIGEAAVQVGVACDTVHHLHGCDWSHPTTHQDLDEMLGLTLRLLLSALPFVADAAGLDMAVMGWNDLGAARAWEFGGALSDT